jgi:acyl dehydratase
MLQVGDEFRHRYSYSQQDVEAYARVSGDTNPLHIDPATGKASLFERNIIHGFLSASVFTKIFGTLWYADGNIYLNQTMEWHKPMFVNVEYEAVVRVKEIYKEKNRVLYECAVYDPAQVKTISGVALLVNKKQYKWN